MIKEDFVSHDNAVLLKAKGFNERCRAFWKDWNDMGALYECDRTQSFEYCTNLSLEEYNSDDEFNIAAPTLQMVLKWLMEVHKFNVDIMLDGFALGGHCGYYCYIQEIDKNNDWNAPTEQVFFETYEACAQEAIKWVLENLIP